MLSGCGSATQFHSDPPAGLRRHQANVRGQRARRAESVGRVKGKVPTRRSFYRHAGDALGHEDVSSKE